MKSSGAECQPCTVNRLMVITLLEWCQGCAEGSPFQIFVVVAMQSVPAQILPGRGGTGVAFRQLFLYTSQRPNSSAFLLEDAVTGRSFCFFYPGFALDWPCSFLCLLLSLRPSWTDCLEGWSGAQSKPHHWGPYPVNLRVLHYVHYYC